MLNLNQGQVVKLKGSKRLWVKLHEQLLGAGIEAKMLAQKTKKRAGIYALFHLPTGKVYIGQSKNVLTRLARHRYALRNGVVKIYPELQAHWLKNPDDFEFRILHVGTAFLYDPFRYMVEKAYHEYFKSYLYRKENTSRQRLSPIKIYFLDGSQMQWTGKRPILAGIYALEKTFNGKRYVGRGTDLIKRLQQHRSKLEKKQHTNLELQSDFEANPEKFRFRILWSDACFKRDGFLKLFEARVIRYYEHHWSPGLYNRQGTYKYRRDGQKHSVETLQRMSKARQGQPYFQPPRPGIGIKVTLGPYVWIFKSRREAARLMSHIKGSPKRSTLDKYYADPHILNVVEATAAELKHCISAEDLDHIKTVRYEILRSKPLKPPGIPSQRLKAYGTIYPSIAEASRALTLLKDAYAKKHGQIKAQKAFGSVNRKSLKGRWLSQTDMDIVSV